MQVEMNGLPVFADTGGRVFVPDLPTLVFIHGAQHDHFVWKPLVTRFADAGRNMLAVDLPGHGRSGGPPLNSIESLAEWLVALLVKVGAEAASSGGGPAVGGGVASASGAETAPVVLVGHSMGSLIALEAAARLPGQVRHLVMVGTAIPMPVAPALLDAARDDEPKAMALINRWSNSPLAARGAVGGHGLWLPAINLRIMERQPPGVLYNDLAACNAYMHGPAALAQLSCPVTIVAGTADRMTPVKAAHSLAAQIPNAQLIELENVGHALLAEAPAAVGTAIADALNP
ncbi:MAG: alpha/beta hydrolase [Rhodocyclaceae bacterium]|nr:alpha/beta hydrolase [Rhodocyclaceae bacterium]